VSDTPRFRIDQQDAVAWLRSIPDSCVDLVITDPPYQSLEKYRAVGTTTRLKHSKASSNDWFDIFPDSRFPELLLEIHRVLRRNRHFYLYCNAETMFVVKPLAEDVGFKFWKPLVWDKIKIGMGYHYRARYEFILFFEKGKRKLNDLGVPDILQGARVWRGYPTEKPVCISNTLVRQSTQPGEMVIDPFMGSGSVGVAAILQGRLFLGNDMCAEAVDVARQRIGDAGGVEDATLGEWTLRNQTDRGV
jgi:site-specific DNA-methyltransferase (adenine-specific)